MQWGRALDLGWTGIGWGGLERGALPSLPFFCASGCCSTCQFSSEAASGAGTAGELPASNTVTCLSVRIPLDLLCCFYWICFLKLPSLPLLHQQHSGLCCISKNCFLTLLGHQKPVLNSLALAIH